MNKATRNICATAVFSLLAAGVSATPVFLSGVTETSGWIDTDKSWVDDTQLCWAASAANVLAFTGWTGGAGHQTADQIFGDFVSHWNDMPGNPYYAINWWFTGNNAKQNVSGWAQLTDNNLAGYYTQDLFIRNIFTLSLYQQSAFETKLRNSIVSGVSNFGLSGLSLMIGWYTNGIRTGGHLLTLWGIDTDSDTLYVTDSDDREHQLEQIKYDQSTGRLTNYGGGRGYLEYEYALDMWSAGEGDPLPRLPIDVPEPSSMALLMAGLAGVLKVRKDTAKKAGARR